MSENIIRWARSLAMPLLLLASGLVVTGCGYNAIPTEEQQAKAAWSQVENQYQRRADLIPNLVETVKGFAAQEREVLVAVTEARAKATSSNVNIDPTDPAQMQQFSQAQGALSSALSRLLLVVERYPDLKSNQNFLALQAQLEGTENRIAIARRDYIESVRTYNTTLKTFPGMIWAKTLHAGYEPMANFEAEPGSQENPTVDFNTPDDAPSPPAEADNDNATAPAEPAEAPAAEPAPAN